ncbi:MAG: HAD hydrolase-like protein [Betaproteobacteria bacterium]
MNKQFETIIFDFDGTLIDSAPGILNAFSAALREVGIEAQAPLDSRLIGPPLRETLIRLSGSDDAAVIQSLSHSFKQHYDTVGVLNTKAYPGVDNMLKRFVAAGSALHLCTNKRISVTQAILEHLGWAGEFISVYALDMVEPRLPGKPQLLAKQIVEQGLVAEKTIYVGDKQEDGAAADANTMAFYYAAWGYGELKKDQLKTNWTWLNHPETLCTIAEIAALSGGANQS